MSRYKIQSRNRRNSWSERQRRARRNDTISLWLGMAVCALALAGLIYAAAAIDASNGISVGQSLANHGL